MPLITSIYRASHLSLKHFVISVMAHICLDKDRKISASVHSEQQQTELVH